MPIWPFRSHDPTPFMPVAQHDDTKDAPPKYIDETRFNAALDDVRAMNAKLDQMAGFFTGYMTQPGGQQQQQQQPRQEPAIIDITDEEYAQAVLQGDAAKITTRMNAMTERKAREIRQEYNVRLTNIEQQGAQILDNVTGEVGQTAMGAMPYYQLFKTDIDASLKQLPLHQRTPEMRLHIYNSIVGANEEKVYQHRRAEEARIASERGALGAPGRTQAQDQGPTPASVFGEDVIKPSAVARGGANLWAHRTPDEWARNRYGVKDLNEAAVYATNVHAIENCRTCFGPIIGGKCHCRRSA